MKSYTGPPATLGSTATAQARLIVWCRECRHKVEPDPAAMAERYGAEPSVPDWHQRLVCSASGSRQVDFVVTGAAPCGQCTTTVQFRQLIVDSGFWLRDNPIQRNFSFD